MLLAISGEYSSLEYITWRFYYRKGAIMVFHHILERIWIQRSIYLYTLSRASESGEKGSNIILQMQCISKHSVFVDCVDIIVRQLFLFGGNKCVFVVSFFLWVTTKFRISVFRLWFVFLLCFKLSNLFN